jgi:AcrR family transcriptional regulator
MAEPVKTTRTYNSPRRREQAAATRARVLDAARVLFERQGYAATTIAQIAAEAGVALKTVYVAFETKSGILRTLWNAQLRGGDEDTPVAEQQWYREVLAEPDAEQQLRANARNSRNGKERVGTVLDVIHSAAPVDPDIAALWERIETEYHENQRAIVESISDKGALEPGIDVDRAADILWTINHPNQWHLLVAERGWTADQYEEWCADLACSQLLARRAPPVETRRRRRS